LNTTHRFSGNGHKRQNTQQKSTKKIDAHNNSLIKSLAKRALKFMSEPMDANQNPSPKTWRPLSIAAGVCAVLGASGALAKEWGLIITLIFSIAAIVLSIKDRKEAKNAGEKTAYATSSLVIGIIFTVVNTIKIIFWFVVLAVISSAFGGHY
jgi:F0F1-type ATP synthase assembly protein I